VTDLLVRLGPVRAVRELRRDFDRAMLVLAAGDLVASLAFSLVFPFLTIFLTTVLHASATEAGVIVGVYSVCSIASAAAGGWLADRFGRKVVLVASITGTALVVMAMGQTTDLPSIFVLTMLLGVVDPAFIPAARAAVADVVPEEQRPRAYGLLGVASAVGWIAGPSIGAGLASFGYPLLFFVSGVILLTVDIILVFAFHETLASRHVHPDPLGPAPEPVGVALAVASGSEHPRSLGADGSVPHVPRTDGDDADAGRAAHAWTAFLAFLPLGVLIHATTFQWVATLPIRASRDLAVSTPTWGLLFALNGLGIVLFQLRISSATERLLKPRTMAIGLAMYAAGYLLVALLDGPAMAVPVLAAVVTLATIGEMLVSPVEPAFVSDLSPAHARGRYQGMFGAAAGLGSALGPPIGGLVLDVAPGPGLWVGTCAVTLVGAAALWWLGGSVRKHGLEAGIVMVERTA
jgi:MFS family permease